MRVRRGFFRLWVVASVIWSSTVIFTLYGEVISQYQQAKEIELRQSEQKKSVSPTLKDGTVNPFAQYTWVTEPRWTPDPYRIGGFMLLAAFGVPAVVFAIGAAIGWAFRGFNAS